MVKKIAAVLSLGLLATAAVPSSAQAAVKTTDSVSKCAANRGTYYTYQNGSIQNGTLYIGACRYGARMYGTINVKYIKSGGNPTAIKLGWRWVASSGSPANAAHVESATSTARSGEQWMATWTAGNPGYQPESSTTVCLQGVMLVGTTTYVTKTIC